MLLHEIAIRLREIAETVPAARPELLGLADAIVTSPDGRVEETRLGMARPRFRGGRFIADDGRVVTAETLFRPLPRAA